MAQRHMVVDDINGLEASETVTFGLDVTVYEIDLTEENAKTLRDALLPFTANGRVLTVDGREVPKRGERSGPDPVEVRAWAAENGVEVNPRGRINKDVLKAFAEAQTLAPAGTAPENA